MLAFIEITIGDKTRNFRLIYVNPLSNPISSAEIPILLNDSTLLGFNTVNNKASRELITFSAFTPNTSDGVYEIPDQASLVLLLNCGSALNIVNKYLDGGVKTTLKIALEDSLGSLLDKMGDPIHVAV